MFEAKRTIFVIETVSKELNKGAMVSLGQFCAEVITLCLRRVVVRVVPYGRVIKKIPNKFSPWTEH